jgi:hypothetical protein
MKNLDETSEEYVKILDQLVRLHEMKQAEKPRQVSPDTLVLAGANLIGILLIINHERLHPLTTRAMNMAVTPR